MVEKISKYKCIGEFLSTLKFIDPHRSRISSAIQKNGIPAELVTKYATSTKIYKEHFHKVIKLAGFRPGTPAFNKSAVSRILRDLESGGGKHSKYLWDLYKSCAFEYICDELSALNKLLGSVPLNESESDSENLLTKICSHAFEYHVSEQEVRALYEIWCIELPASPESIFKTCKIGDSEKRELRETIHEITGSIDNLNNNIETLGAAIEEIKQDQAENVKEINTAVDDAISKAELACDQISEIERLTTQINLLAPKSELAKLNEDLNTLKEDIQANHFDINDYAKITEINELKESLNGSTKRKLAGIEASITATFQKSMSDLEDRVGIKIENIKSTNSQQIISHDEYQSPLEKRTTLEKPNFKISELNQLLHSWQKEIEKHDRSFSIEELLLYHVFFSQHYLMIIDNPIVFKTWLNVTKWEYFSQDLVTSPMWLKEKDWKSGAQFLFGPSKNEPRVLQFHNFDIGLVDSYLFPSVELWRLKNPGNTLGKIILYPSNPSFEIPTHLISHAAILRTSADSLPPMAQLRSTDLEKRSKFIKNPVGLSPKTFEKWTVLRTTIDINLETIAKSLQIDIPSHKQNNFIKYTTALNYYFESGDAILVSAKINLLPWIRVNYDESISAEFYKLLEGGYI